MEDVEDTGVIDAVVNEREDCLDVCLVADVADPVLIGANSDVIDAWVVANISLERLQASCTRCTTGGDREHATLGPEQVIEGGAERGAHDLLAEIRLEFFQIS